MFKFFKKKKSKSLGDVFHHVYYRSGLWRLKETGSGIGSTLANTENIRKEIPDLLRSIDARSLLDAPCGDFNWMSHVDLSGIDYTGADIISKLIRQNQKKFPSKKFIVADITLDPLPAADVVLCRDCFIHLPNELVLSAINNFRKSGSKYLLTNTYDFITVNKNIGAGEFRMLNLGIPPFSMPAPISVIEEGFTDGNPDKKLALWKL